MDIFREIEDILYGTTPTKKACISPMNYDHKNSNTSESSTYNQNMYIHHFKIEADSVPSTSSKHLPQDVRKLHEEESSPLDVSLTTSNQPDSTLNTLTSGFSSNNQDPSTSARNPYRGLCENFPDVIFGVITSELKTGFLGLNDIFAQAEKIRILSELATKCNKLAAKLKGKMKRQEDDFKPKHPNEKLKQGLKAVHTKNESLPSKFAENSAQEVSDVIPRRIKGIISKATISEKNALGINDLEVFFNKAKNKRNITRVAKSLKMPISRLKKQLGMIKKSYYCNPERGNKEENQFMKRLERIIGSLNE